MYIIFNILAAILTLVSAFSLLSYGFAWYEAANGEPTLLKDRFAPARLALALRLVAGEALVLLVTVLLHPLGWFRWPGQRAARLEADRRGAGEPILLLHGLFQSPGCWLWLKFRLRRAGWNRVHVVALPPWQDLGTLTERVSRAVDDLRQEYRAERVHLIGHSMGGLIARAYLQLQEGASKVDRCLLLATPHHGSRLVPFALSPLALEAAPSSDLLRRLREAPLPPGPRLTAIQTRHDNIVLPWQSARLEGVPNVELSGMGHTSLLFHPRAVARILAVLKEERHDHPAD